MAQWNTYILLTFGSIFFFPGKFLLAVSIFQNLRFNEIKTIFLNEQRSVWLSQLSITA